MSTDNLLKHQREIILRSHNIVSDYNRQKSEAEIRLKQEKQAAESTWKQQKETVEATWKQEKEAIENNWNSIRTQGDSVLQSVNKSAQSVQDALEKSRWQDKLAGGTQRFQTISDNSDVLKQMKAHQSISEQVSKEIQSLLTGFGWGGWQRILAGVAGFIVTVALLIFYLVFRLPFCSIR